MFVIYDIFHSFIFFFFAGFPVMMGILKEERDDVEMVAKFSSSFHISP